MSDLITIHELLAAAADERADTPPLPSVEERRALREAADVPMSHIAAAVGCSGPTIYRVESGTRMRSARSERAYRRVLATIRTRLVERDPHALASL